MQAVRPWRARRPAPPPDRRSRTSESRSCVTITTVRPRLCCRRRIRRSKSAAPIGSRPAVGSSRNRISGSSARARASPARLRMPPDSSAGIFVGGVAAGSPTSAILRPATSIEQRLRQREALAQRHLDVLRHGQRAEQRAVLEQHALARLQRPARGVARARRASWPRTSIRPRSGRSRPRIVRSSTDLPVPEPPTMPITSPRRTSRSRPSWTTLRAEAGRAARGRGWRARARHALRRRR